MTSGDPHGSPTAWTGVGLIIASSIAGAFAIITGDWTLFLILTAVLGIAGVVCMWRGRVMADVIMEDPSPRQDR